MPHTKIGEQVFDVPVPPAMRTFAMQQRILPVAGRVINAIITAFAQLDPAKFARIQDLDLEKLLDEVEVLKVLPGVIPAIGEIFSEMHAGELEKLTRDLLADTKVQLAGVWVPLFGGTPVPGAGDQFDVVFAGRSIDPWRLLYFALRVWYPDFFALAGAVQRGTPQAATESASRG